MQFTNLVDFAGFIRRDLDAFDAYTAQLLLDGAESLVTEYCGWHIAPSITETITVDGSGLRVQPVPTLYLTGVTAIVENGTTLNLANIDYSTHGVLEKIRGGVWTSRRRAITATITHGFTTAPGWLTSLVYAMAGRALSAPVGAVAEASGGESATYTAPYLVPAGQVDLLDAERRMLDRVAIPRTP